MSARTPTGKKVEKWVKGVSIALLFVGLLCVAVFWTVHRFQVVHQQHKNADAGLCERHAIIQKDKQGNIIKATTVQDNPKVDCV